MSNSKLEKHKKVIIFSANPSAVTKSGVTQLSNVLAGKKYSQNYKRTIACDYCGLNKFQIWDIASENLLTTLGFIIRGTEEVLICVDLSLPDTIEQKIKDNIAWVKNTIFPNPRIILVGTKNDVNVYDAKQKIAKLKEQFPGHTIISTSAKENDGIDELRKKIEESPSQQVTLTGIEKEETDTNSLSPYERAKKNLLLIVNQSEKLTEQNKIYITSNITAMEDELSQTSTLENQEIAINKFYNKSQKMVQDKCYVVAQAIGDFVIAAVVATLVFAIGFGIGFAAGSWTGPGAFGTALLAGSFAASITVTAAAGSGASVGVFFAHHMLKKNPLLDALDKVKQAKKDEIEEMLRLQS